MLNIDEIRQLIKLIDESSINEFTYENEGSKVELKKQSGTVQTIQQVAAAPVQAPAPEAQAKQAPVQDAPAKEEAAKEGGNFHKITSPMVGTF
ncbi:acetyl-CoA carboxylase biotin carboxyl carrier protein, partial [Bacillus licheniformis]|nr:acetyl-CoA carboxylase biotin carboxyl carrier protein [Bacillus licheniformis]